MLFKRSLFCVFGVTEYVDMLLCSKNIIFQILYIIVVPLCPASLKRIVFYKAAPSNKHTLLWLVNWPSALWSVEHRKHSLEITIIASFIFQNKC